MSKRPLVIITISYIIGIIIGLYFKINTALFDFLCLIVIISVYIIFLKYFNSRAKFNKHIYIIAIVVFLLSNFNVQLRENKFNNLYKDFTSSEGVVKGSIIAVQSESEYYQNYVVKIDSINDNPKFRNSNILLKVKKNKEKKANKLGYGDSILVHCSFEKPSVRRNFKGFDYSQYLKNKNIYMICKADYDSIHLVKTNSLFVGKMWINRLRDNLKLNLYKLLDKDNADVANAILLGNSNEINEEQRQTFSDANLIHVLAISGMHVTYVVLFWNFILKKADKQKTKYFLIIFLIFFAELTGRLSLCRKGLRDVRGCCFF